MTTQHTPGPWQFIHLHGKHYCVAEQKNGVGLLYNEANARLMAAAPEMLDALRLALTCLDAAADGRLEDVKDEIGGTANIVDEAITRATQSSGEPVMAA